VKKYPRAGIPFLNDHHDVMFKVLTIAGIGYSRAVRAGGTPSMRSAKSA